MNIKDAVEFLDEYFRDYVVYILRLFTKLDETEPLPSVTDPKCKLMTYGLMSAVVGVLLEQFFIKGVSTEAIDFTQGVTIEICFWLFAALLTHGALDLFGDGVEFEKSLSAVLRVFPPAFLVGTYSAFGFYLAATILLANHLNPSKYAAFTDVIVQCALLVRFYPSALAKIVKRPTWRGPATVAFVIAVILAVNMVKIFDYHAPPPDPKCASAPHNMLVVQETASPKCAKKPAVSASQH
jgi:hypothetical protein